MHTFSFRIMADQIGFVAVVLAFVTLMFQSPSVSAKLSQCPCVINVTTATADCHHEYGFRHLKEIPDCVPDTTRELIFHGNNLTYRSGQFQRYIFLTYIDLAMNSRFAPSCDSFDGLTWLKSLNLSSTSLEHLQPCVFSKLNKLETLRLRDSGMQYLSANFFENLNSLNLLDLSSNMFPEISNNIFASLQNLIYLEFFNNLLVFHSNSFFGLSKLEFLTLEFCNVPNATSFPVSIFGPLTQIIEINLEGICSFERFNCEAIDQRLKMSSSIEVLTVDNFVINFLGQGFASLTHLKEIYFGTFWLAKLRTCNVRTLSNKTFQSLTNSPISKVTIKFCKINAILPFAFSMFKNLKYVELSKVIIGQVSKVEGIEIGLQQSTIQHLRLSLHDLTVWISLPIVKGLVSSRLQTLDIYSSPVYSVPCKFFQSLPVSLKHLHLTHNHIMIVCFCDLVRLQNLVVLDLSHQNSNIDLQQDVIGRLPKTDIIPDTSSVSNHSEAKYIFDSTDCFVCQKLSSSLRTIDISHSALICILPNILCDSSNMIESLDISFQSKPDCFGAFWKITKYIVSLKYLNAAESGLKTIPNHSFSPLHLLKNLTLHHNFLAIVDFDLQAHVLEYLDLSHNNILYLSQKLTDQLNSIAKHSNLVIHLEGNQLICDCERLYFVAWLRYNSAIYHKDQLMCKLTKSNTTYSLSKIAELHDKLKVECIAKDVLKGCIVGFLVLNIVLGLLWRLWHRRWKIRYLLAIGRKTVTPYHPIEESEIELEYDVYISYERDYDLTSDQTLHKFVAQTLYPEFQRRGLKVLIRDEFEPGIGLYNAISQALRRCKKVVSLISKDYCKDYWNVFEFNVAVLEGIYTKRQVIIPVALENMERDDLHTEIYAYLKSGSVSYFSRYVRNEDLFAFLCEKIRDNRECE